MSKKFVKDVYYLDRLRDKISFDCVSFSDFVRTDTNLDNSVKSIEVLCNILTCIYVCQLIKDSSLICDFGISSCFRTEPVNKAVGGVSNSWHLKGLAVDVYPINCSLAELSSTIKFCNDEYGFLKEFIVYKNFIHFSINPNFYV